MAGKKKNDNCTMLAYKFYEIPDDMQTEQFVKNFGSTRWLWNRMLADHNTLYTEIGCVPDNTPADYKDLDECQWLREADSLALANVQLNLNRAFTAFYNKTAKYPRFKKKSSHRDSYTTNVVGNNIKLRIDGKSGYLKLPKIKGEVYIRIHRKIKSGGKLKSVTVRREPDGRFYFSLLYEYPKVTAIGDVDDSKCIGLDMSLPKFYVDSDGNAADYAKPYHKVQSRIAREQHLLSKMTRGSSNYNKQKLKIAKLHAKAKRQRSDTLHKLSKKLVDSYDIICIEDLSIKGMHKLWGKSVSDNGWSMFVNMLEYKSVLYGSNVIKVDRFFPSSKTCLNCGYVHKELTLADRIYECPVCGNVMDRDIQAAINIRNEGLRIYNAA